MSTNRISVRIFDIFINIIILTTTAKVYGESTFHVYWNIPTFMCRRYGIPISNTTRQFGIMQNANDDFRGDQIAILYDPGKFPAILQNSSSKKFFYRNHGVPQEGDLYEHLKIFETHVNELIPDKNFSGVAVIDFESWRPIYRQNFGTLQPYKDLSIHIERQKHPFWSDRRLEREALKRFELAGRNFMEQTLFLAQKMRPQASWGYYAFPYCFNWKGNVEACPSYISKENNGIQWLIDSSDIVFPSVYMSEEVAPKDRVPMVRGRINEAMRLVQRVKDEPKPRVFVYYRYVYTDTLRYLSETDTFVILNTIKQTGADAIVLWGSSDDLNSNEKCTKFYDYLVNTLGPVIESLQPAYAVNINGVNSRF